MCTRVLYPTRKFFSRSRKSIEKGAGLLQVASKKNFGIICRFYCFLESLITVHEDNFIETKLNATICLMLDPTDCDKVCQPFHEYKVGLYGWRKKLLYVLMILFVILVIINTALLIWIIRMLKSPFVSFFFIFLRPSVFPF